MERGRSSQLHVEKENVNARNHRTHQLHLVLPVQHKSQRTQRPPHVPLSPSQRQWRAWWTSFLSKSHALSPKLGGDDFRTGGVMRTHKGIVRPAVHTSCVLFGPIEKQTQNKHSAHDKFGTERCFWETRTQVALLRAHCVILHFDHQGKWSKTQKRRINQCPHKVEFCLNVRIQRSECKFGKVQVPYGLETEPHWTRPFAISFQRKQMFPFSFLFCFIFNSRQKLIPCGSPGTLMPSKDA